jgi:hypothetical protein
MEGVAHKMEVTATALYETVAFGLEEDLTKKYLHEREII